MIEWWTYRPSDFLMFAPRIYWRLFEAQNLAWWPAQLLWLGLGLAWLRVWRGPAGAAPAAERGWAAAVAWAGLALAWSVVAVDFQLGRFAPINWPAQVYAMAFGVQAAALCGAAAVRGWQAAPPPRRRVALGLALWALIGHPFLAWIDGRPWTQAETFGLAPDPTAVGTLATLLACSAPGRLQRGLWCLLFAMPLAWCALSAATLATMDAWLPAAAVAAAAGFAVAALRRGA